MEALISQASRFRCLFYIFNGDLYIDNIIYVNDDLEINGDFTLDSIHKMDDRSDFIFIRGNLVINGDMNPKKQTLPNILVLGNLIANNIENGEELVTVNGDLRIKNLICGTFNHGALKVIGETTAKYIINYDHLMLLPNSKATHIINAYKTSSKDLLEYDLYKNDLLTKAKEKYIISEHDYVSIKIDELALDIKKGKTIFKD